MKHAWAIVALLGACVGTTAEQTGAGPEELDFEPPAAADDAPAAGGGEGDVREASGSMELAVGEQQAQPPVELKCVSESSMQPGETHSSVWRVTLFLAGERPSGNFARTPLFPSHGGVWSSTGTPVRTEPLATDGALRFKGQGETPLSLDLQRRGLFFMGELVLDGSAVQLLCWDQIEVFGSSWSSQPRALPAHYDATAGSCVGNDGAPAHNPLPLAFVLESGFGECADLRGQMLNRDDYSGPDVALNLRGANLDGTKLHFANLAGSFEGARMGGFELYYGHVSGSADTSTQLPQDQSCELKESPWAGTSLSCYR
jgi:hypothetical protein